jgi:tape measure domain-containing protein
MTDSHRIEIQVDSSSAVTARNNLSALQQATQTTTNTISALAGATSTTSNGILLTSRAARETVQAMTQLTSSTNAATQSTRNITTAMSAAQQSSARWVSELNNATHSANRLNTELATTTQRTNQAANSMNQFKSVLSAFGVVTGVAGLAMVAKNILQINIEMEALRARLAMTMPSLAAANNAFQLILKIAKETPQSIDEITKAFLLLKNSGIDPSEKTMRGWIDVASKFGGTADMLTGVIRQYGQATMKGALHAQDANAMIERGIPLYGLLTQVTGKSAGAIIKMMEAGELNNKIMEKAINLLFEMSSGSSAKAMETMRGQIEALGSAWSGFVDVLMGDKSEGMIKNMLGLLTATLEHFTKLMGNSIDAQIAEIKYKIAAHRNQGATGGFVSGLLGVYDEKAELAKIDALLAAKKKGIDDTAALEKANLDTKKAQEIQTQIDISKNAEKFMKQQMGLQKESQKAYFNDAQEKYNISKKLFMSLAAAESGFDNSAKSKTTSATGIFQMTKGAAKDMGTSIESILKDEGVAIDKGAGYLAQKMKESNNNIAEAIARWHDGSGKINALIAKHKGFDVNFVSDEGQELIKRVVAGMDVLGVTVADLERPYQKSAQASKHAADEQQRLSDAVARNDKQLTESTAFGKYNATIDELVESFKRGGISQATYSQGIENANETLLKNTDYVVANAKALELQAKAREKMLGHVSDYNDTIDESTANLKGGLISRQQHGLNVAEANAGLMNRVTDKNIPTSKVGEVIGAKSAIKATQEMEKFKDEMDKASASFDTFGNSGKMAFDGILGGISAVASAATSFSDDMAKLNATQIDAQTKYDAVIKSVGATEEQKATATKQFADEKEKYDKRSFATEINGAMSIAGATAKMFNQKSVAARAFHGIEMGMAVVSMAMSAKKMVVDLAAGAAAMFGQGGFAGFAGVAAMAAVMAGLGVAMTGGGSKTVDNTTPATIAEGTVLGNPTATSNSVENIIKTLNDIHAEEYPELKAMADGFRGVDRSMYELQRDIAKSTANYSNMNAIGNAPQISQPSNGGFINSVGWLGGILGLFKSKTTVSQIGEGIVIEAGKITLDAIAGAVNATSFSKFLVTKKSLFGSSSKVVETIGTVSQDLLDDLSAIKLNLTKGIYGIIDYFKLFNTLQYKLSGNAAPFLKIDFFKNGKQVDDVGKVLTDQINAWTDRIATNVFGTVFGEYQRLGEGMMETAVRLTTQVAAVRGIFSKMNAPLGEANLGMVTFSDTLVSLYASSAKADDGLKNFMAAMNELYNFTTTKGQRSQTAINKTSEYITSISGNANFNPYDTDALKTLTNTKMADLAVATDAATIAETAVKTLNVAVQDYNNPTPSDGEKGLLNTGADAGWKSRVWKSKDPYSLSWSDIGSTFEKVIRDNSGNNKFFAEAVRYFDEKETIRASALATQPGVASITLEQSTVDLAVAQTTTKNLAEETAKLTGELDSLTEAEKTANKVLALQNQFIKLTRSEQFATERERAEFLKTEYKGMTDDLLDPKYNAPFKEITDAMKKAGVEGKYTAEVIQRFVWSLEDAKKATNALKEANGYFTDFAKSIHDWVRNLKATKVGSTEMQLASTKSDYEKLLIKIDTSKDAESKRDALSKLTYYADSYISNLEKAYGANNAAAAIEEVVNKVSGYETLNIEDLQLGVLKDIKEGVHKFPSSLDALTTAIATSKAVYDANPTLANEIKLDALAKIGLQLESMTIKGADESFIKSLVGSITSDKGMIAQIDLAINSDIADKKTVVDGIVNNLGSLSLTIGGLSFATGVKDATKTSVSEIDGLILTVEKTLLDKDLTQTQKDSLNEGLALLTGLKANVQLLSIDPNNAVLKESIAKDTKAITGLLVNVSPTKANGFADSTKNLTNGITALVNVNPKNLTTTDKQILQTSLDSFKDVSLKVGAVLTDSKSAPLTKATAIESLNTLYGSYSVNVATIVNSMTVSEYGKTSAKTAVAGINGLTATIKELLVNPDLTIDQLNSLNSSLRLLKGLQANIDLLAIDPENQKLKDSVNADMAKIKGLSVTIEGLDLSAAYTEKVNALSVDVDVLLVPPNTASVLADMKTFFESPANEIIASLKLDVHETEKQAIVENLGEWGSSKLFNVSAGVKGLNNKERKEFIALQNVAFSEQYISIKTAIADPTVSPADYIKGITLSDLTLGVDTSKVNEDITLLVDDKTNALNVYKDTPFTKLLFISESDNFDQSVTDANSKVDKFTGKTVTITAVTSADLANVVSGATVSISAIPDKTVSITASDGTLTIGTTIQTITDNLNGITSGNRVIDLAFSSSTLATLEQITALNDSIARDGKAAAVSTGEKVSGVFTPNAIPEMIATDLTSSSITASKEKTIKNKTFAERHGEGKFIPFSSLDSKDISTLKTIFGEITSEQISNKNDGALSSKGYLISGVGYHGGKDYFAAPFSNIASNKDSYKMFATGGAFDGGVVSRPTAFDMGLMGEAGAEAIMPLVNVGGSLGVRAITSGTGDTKVVAAIRSGFGSLINYLDMTKISGFKIDAKVLNEMVLQVQEIMLTPAFKALSKENKGVVDDISGATAVLNSIKLNQDFIDLQTSKTSVVDDLIKSGQTIDTIKLNANYLALSTVQQGLVADFVLAQDTIESLKLTTPYTEMKGASDGLIQDLADAKTTIGTLYLDGGYSALYLATIDFNADLEKATKTVKEITVADTIANLKTVFDDLLNSISKAVASISTPTTTTTPVAPVVEPVAEKQAAKYGVSEKYGSILKADINKVIASDTAAGVLSNYGIAANDASFDSLGITSAKGYSNNEIELIKKSLSIESEKAAAKAAVIHPYDDSYSESFLYAIAQNSPMAVLKDFGIDSSGLKSWGEKPDDLKGYEFYSPLEKGLLRTAYAYAKNYNHSIGLFADGGAFTNGIVSTPTAFNMGIMGESGSEGILPLANVGGKLGVHASNDSSNDTAQTIEELKAQNRRLEAVINVLQAGFKEMREASKNQTDVIDGLRTDTRMQKRG